MRVLGSEIVKSIRDYEVMVKGWKARTVLEAVIIKSVMNDKLEQGKTRHVLVEKNFARVCQQS